MLSIKNQKDLIQTLLVKKQWAENYCVLYARVCLDVSTKEVRSTSKLMEWLEMSLEETNHPNDTVRLMAFTGQLYNLGLFPHEKTLRIIKDVISRCAGKQGARLNEEALQTGVDTRRSKLRDYQEGYSEIVEKMKHLYDSSDVAKDSFALRNTLEACGIGWKNQSKEEPISKESLYCGTCSRVCR